MLLRTKLNFGGRRSARTSEAINREPQNKGERISSHATKVNKKQPQHRRVNESWGGAGWRRLSMSFEGTGGLRGSNTNSNSSHPQKQGGGGRCKAPMTKKKLGSVSAQKRKANWCTKNRKKGKPKGASMNVKRREKNKERKNSSDCSSLNWELATSKSELFKGRKP